MLFHNSRKHLIIALDVNTIDAAEALVAQTKEFAATYKIGLELFTAVGPQIFDVLKKHDVQFFLDLKLHDIPNTVHHATLQAQKLGARFLTVHAMAGTKVLESAAQVKGITLLAVSVLTHHSEADLKELGFTLSPEALALKLIKNAYAAGVRGCICSPNEAAAIRKTFGKDLVIVCPGVRPRGASLDDQGRVATPAQAIKNGADYIVVGRPITQAKDPPQAAKDICDEMENL